MSLEAAQAQAVLPDTQRLDTRRLRKALDCELLTSALRTAWRPGGCREIAIEHVSVERVHPARDGAFVLEIAVKATSPQGGMSRRFHAELPAGDARSRFERAVARLGDAKRNQLADGDLADRLLLLEGPGLVLRAVGLDERIPQLGALAELPGLLGLEPHATLPAPPFEIAFLAHRYGKRAVLRIVGVNGKSAILKLYKRQSDRSHRVATLMRELSSAAREHGHALALPKLLGELADGSGHAMEDIIAASLDAAPARQARDGWRGAGQALAALHRIPSHVDDHHTTQDEIALIERWVGLVVSTFPELARDFGSALAAASRALTAAGTYEPALIHRDFHEKQVLLRGEGAVLIDFDTVSLGNPAQDAGNFLAHLDLRELQRGDDMAPACAAFMTGYAGASALGFGAQAHAHRRVTLLRLACLHALTSHRQGLAIALLNRASAA